MSRNRDCLTPTDRPPDNFRQTDHNGQFLRLANYPEVPEFRYSKRREFRHEGLRPAWPDGRGGDAERVHRCCNGITRIQSRRPRRPTWRKYTKAYPASSFRSLVRRRPSFQIRTHPSFHPSYDLTLFGGTRPLRSIASANSFTASAKSLSPAIGRW